MKATFRPLDRVCGFDDCGFLSSSSASTFNHIIQNCSIRWFPTQNDKKKRSIYSLNKVRTVLDIGCGYGSFGAHLFSNYEAHMLQKTLSCTGRKDFAYEMAGNNKTLEDDGPAWTHLSIAC
ncbi:hypothetical protein Leryth_005941 [Lithospermum erythrorhizon]|nr:hypothetical protein Leryth_005941 [Lithospermum erythrorhizon]